MKKIWMMVVLAMAFGAPLFAQDAQPKKEEPKAEEPKAEEPKKEEPKAEEKVDAFKIYRTKGNTWTYKSVSKAGGFENISYVKTEVIEVTEEKAKIKTTVMDKDKKELTSSESEIPFKAAEVKEAPKAETPAPAVTTETIKVEAGEFECNKVETEANGAKTTSWTCKKCGALVKSTTSGSWGDATNELVEYKIS